MGTAEGAVTRIVACVVFKPALEYLRLQERYPDVQVTYLPSNLHLRPQHLKERVAEEIRAARERGERIIVLYGNCFPDIEEFCREQRVAKVPGDYCYEMLLGTEEFQRLLDETAGTYFAERDLVSNFQENCVKPLELEDEEMRKYCFDNYRRMLLVEQPADHDIVSKAGEIAEFLGLPLDVRQADYSHLEERLTRLLGHERS